MFHKSFNREEVDIDIVTINTWRMEGIVAESMVEKGVQDPKVFLVGDSAHAFPPSGGFGMNTGIGDAHNLAHKISESMIDSSISLKSYHNERKLIGQLTRDFAQKNFDKSIFLAKLLNLSKDNMDMFQSVVGTVLPSFLQKTALHTGVSIGLTAGLSVASSTSSKEFIESDNANSIRLMFPNLDFGQVYDSMCVTTSCPRREKSV